MRIRAFLYPVCLTFLLSSCDYINQAYKETFDISEERPGTRPNVDIADDYEDAFSNLEEELQEDVPQVINLFEAGDKLDTIQQQLQDMFPGKSVQVYPPHIYFQPKEIRLQLVDPDIADNIDWYSYKAETGAWSKGDPVKISMSRISDNLPLEAVRFSVLTPVYHQLLEKTETVEGGEIPSNIYFSFHVKPWNWNAWIYGSRADYNFETDIDGKELVFERR